nr:unnamed protein product [Haemonchus contortus]
MQDSRSKDVTRPTFYFLNVLQLVWIIWNALCMSSTFVLGVPAEYEKEGLAIVRIRSEKTTESSDKEGNERKKITWNYKEEVVELD